jgi:hypothetical protein
MITLISERNLAEIQEDDVDVLKSNGTSCSITNCK